MREEHCEAAQLATAERKHGFIRNPTDLRQKGFVKASGCNEGFPKVRLEASVILQNQKAQITLTCPGSLLQFKAGGLLSIDCVMLLLVISFWRSP